MDGWNVLAGRYRLRERIAAGGTGEVWRADDEMLERQVAVKLLRPEYASDAATLARFESEARHAGRLSHPNVVGVYDYGRDSHADMPFLVMELVNGPSLAAVLAAGRQSPIWVLDVIGQVGTGLAAAHAAGLVHRDIKPGNLLFAPDGHVKITDFGIASLAGAASQTQSGMLLGTPAYLAPERAAGHPATPASDMYSLGVVAWEALVGEPPFTGAPLDVAMSHAHRQLPPLPPQLPAEVTSLIGALTERDPDVRPSGTDVAAEAAKLRAKLTAGAIAGARLPALPPSPRPGPTDTLVISGIDALPPATVSERLRTFGRRRPAALVAGGLVAVIVMALLLANAAGGQQPTASGSSPDSTSTSPATITVDNAALDGQPVDTVLADLRQSGLRPRVNWTHNDHFQPGTVITIQPAGRLSPSAVVTVTAAMRSQGHGDHQHGNGNGDGNGD